jgi:hypothetical protein
MMDSRLFRTDQIWERHPLMQMRFASHASWNPQPPLDLTYGLHEQTGHWFNRQWWTLSTSQLTHG